jgi:hypothetical protein
LVAALGAGGCKEDNGDDTPPAKDAGGGGTTDAGGGGGTTDAGATDAGAKDSGSTATDAGSDAAPPVMCGGKACMAYSPNALVPAFPPGCAKSTADAEVCGLAGYGANAYPEAGFPAFLEKDAPGKESPSCGAFLESKIEMVADGGQGDGGADAGAMNGAIDTKRVIMVSGMTIDVALVYPGCCTPLGFCSGDTAKGTSVSTFGTNASNGGFGCLDPKVFLQAAPAALQQIKCDPTSGMIMLPSGDAGASDAGASDASADAGNG